MTDAEILAHVDHTALKAVTTAADIDKLCGEALKYKTASVCIPPTYIEYARAKFGAALPIATVVGFPLGYNCTALKAVEAAAAVKDGADEVDMVINIGAVKNANFSDVQAEIAILKQTIGNKILKVIVETCYLSNEEKIQLCKCVTDAGADYIKTSTGFGSAGATLDDVLLFKAHIGAKVKIKAAGGIKTREEMVAFLEAGCERLGTSAASLLMN
jgi:deoxyribose-phosphate aldolase